MPDAPAEPDLRTPADGACIALTTAPPDVASSLAHTLVEERLAACVNLVPGVRSVYRWRGAVQDDPETLLVLKTRRDRLDALKTRLEALHPYEVPEWLVLAPEAGSAAYLAWLGAASTPEEPRPSAPGGNP